MDVTTRVEVRRGATLRRLFGWYDCLWRRLHRVRRIDALLSVSPGRYRRAPRTFPDGVRLERGDRLAILHFNHEFFADPAAGDPGNRHGALRFRRQLERSFGRLARQAEADPQLQSVKAVHGVNWFRPHGARMGFVVERLPDGLRTRLLILHFRLLLRAFFPALARQERDRLQPHAWWLTRRDLLVHFGSHRDRGP